MKQGTDEPTDLQGTDEPTDSVVDTADLRPRLLPISAYLDRLRLRGAVAAWRWARRTIGRIRAKRGRDFIGADCDVIDRHRAVFTELDQAEERRRVLRYKF